MPKYLVNHRYSNGNQFVFEAGQTVKLSEADAHWLGKDSPGLLTAVREGGDFVAAPPPNRMYTNPTGRRDVSTITVNEPEVEVTPAARKLAGEQGVDLNDVTGSGKDGRITYNDVAKYVERVAVGE